MSVGNTDDKLVLTIAPIDTCKIFSQHDTTTSSSSSSTPRTASKSSLSISSALPYDLRSYSKSHNMIKSMHEVFQKMYSECEASVSYVSTRNVIIDACYL